MATLKQPSNAPEDWIEVQNAKIKVWYDNENNIGRVIAAGDFDEQAAIQESELVKQVMQEHGQIDWLVDVSDNNKVDSGARKIFSDLMSEIDPQKLSFFGGNVFMRTVVNMVMSVTKVKNGRHFSTEEEAFKWLQQK